MADKPEGEKYKGKKSRVRFFRPRLSLKLSVLHEEANSEYWLLFYLPVLISSHISLMECLTVV